MRRPRRSCGLVFALLLAFAGTSPARTSPGGVAPVVRVRATAPFAACTTAAADAFTRTRGIAVRVETGDAVAGDGVDVLVGDDDELVRLLEGGALDVASAVDLGRVPWVLVTADGAGGPRGLADLDATLSGPLHVLGGAAGREARTAVRLAPERLVVSTDPRILSAARTAVVPATLAGPGRRQPLSIRPLIAVAAVRAGLAGRGDLQALLRFFASPEGRAAFARCTGATEDAGKQEPGARGFGRGVEDWWLPACSLQRNSYVDPGEVLGPPDATGRQDQYTGMMSLGQGGWVVVDMGGDVTDQPGDDVRVYQTTSGEPVTLYAGASPAGPFTLIAQQRYCGNRTGGGVFSNHCDFDLAEGRVGSARYLKVEDGELYPCLGGQTRTEGADFDAVESLNR